MARPLSAPKSNARKRLVTRPCPSERLQRRLVTGTNHGGHVGGRNSIRSAPGKSGKSLSRRPHLIVQNGLGQPRRLRLLLSPRPRRRDRLSPRKTGASPEPL